MESSPIPHRDALAQWFRLPRMRSRQGMGTAWQGSHLRVRRVRPADLGDRGHTAARQQAAAHCLVLGRLPDGNPFQRDFRPAAAEASRDRLVPHRLDARPQAALRDGRSGTVPAVRSGRGRRGEPSFPDQERSSRRRAGPQPRRQDADHRRDRTRGWQHAGPPAVVRDLLIQRSRPWRFVEAAAHPDATIKTDGWSGYAGVPSDRHETHVVGKTPAHLVFPWIHQIYSGLKARPKTYNMSIMPEPGA